MKVSGTVVAFLDPFIFGFLFPADFFTFMELVQLVFELCDKHICLMCGYQGMEVGNLLLDVVNVVFESAKGASAPFLECVFLFI